MTCEPASQTAQDSVCCEPTDIICVSIPCTTTIQILGLTLTLGPVCLRLFSGSGVTLTNAQVTQVVKAVTDLLRSLGAAIVPQA